MNYSKKILVPGALAIAVAAGITIGTSLNAMNAQAADITPTAAQNQQAPQDKPDRNYDPSKGGHVGKNGKKEELLTGTSADKVKAAALAAVPGGTIQRVETDAEGSPYEAHMTKSDGTRVTVKLDNSFKVTSTENGMH